MGKILVRGARQLLTMHGSTGPRRGSALRELGLIEDGAVLIENGIIVNVGTSRRVENLGAARGAREVDATGRVVMPGFVDSHTHLISGPPHLNGYDLRIQGAPEPDRAELTMHLIGKMTGKRLLADAHRHLHRFMSYGTTTIEAKSGYGLGAAMQLKCLRVIDRCAREQPIEIVPTYFGGQVIPSQFEDKLDEYVDWLCSDMMPQIHRRSLARFVDVSCARGSFTVAHARQYLTAAQHLGFGLKVHADQFERTSGARLGVEMGAISVDHNEEAGTAEAHALAGSATIATLLPGSGFHLGQARYAPARMLIDAGCAVALATGFDMETSPTYSMPAVLALACAQLRMNPAEAICAATINGAHALGIAGRVGSIEYGKQADLLILDVSDYREAPYFFGMNPVRSVIKKGRPVVPELGG